MGEKSGVVGKVVHYYWIIESAKKWIMECVNEQYKCERAADLAALDFLCLQNACKLFFLDTIFYRDIETFYEIFIFYLVSLSIEFSFFYLFLNLFHP